MSEKLAEFTRSPEPVVVARILGQVHKAIDHHFPNSHSPTSRQFAKTIHTPEELTQTHHLRPDNTNPDINHQIGHTTHRLIETDSELGEKNADQDEDIDPTFEAISPTPPFPGEKTSMEKVQFDGNESSWNLEQPRGARISRFLALLGVAFVIGGAIAYFAGWLKLGR